MLIHDMGICDYSMTDDAVELLAEKLAAYDLKFTEDGYELCLLRLRDALSEAELIWYGP